MRPSKIQASVRATIVSLWHIGFHLTRDYQNYLVPPRPDNGLRIVEREFIDTYGELVVGNAQGSMDIGEKRRVPQPVDAYDIADDLVVADQLAQYGVFVAEGDAPTQQELRLAQAILIRRAKDLVAEGDKKWARLETRKEISDLNRWAVLQLSEEREWAYEYRPPAEKVALPNCPNCGVEQKIVDPASCWNCSFVLNVEKARKLGVLPETEEPEAVGALPVRGPGGKMQSSRIKE